MYHQRRHPSKVPQCMLTIQLVIFTISNLVLLALSLVAMKKANDRPGSDFPDWAIYNYTASTSGVSFLILFAAIVTSVCRHRRASGPGPFLTPRYFRRCILFTISLHVVTLLLVFHEASVWEGASSTVNYRIPKSLLSADEIIDIPAGSFVFRMTGIVILGGALLTGLSLAIEEPCLREYPSKEVSAKSLSNIQEI